MSRRLPHLIDDQKATAETPVEEDIVGAGDEPRRVEVRVGITVGDEAHVRVPGVKEPVIVPSAVIVEDLWDAGVSLPVNELPGRKFTAVVEAGEDGSMLSDFRLIGEPF